MTLSAEPAEPPKGLRWFWSLHPLCFALFPLLSLYAANLDQIFWTDLLRPLAVVLGTTLLLGLGLFRALRDRQKTAAALSILLFLFFSYGYLLTWSPIIQSEILIFFSADFRRLGPNAYLLPLWLLFLTAALAACLRSRRDFTYLTSLLAVFGVVLVIGPLFTIAANASHIRERPRRPAQASSDSAPPPRAAVGAAGAATELPDIYFIVLDGYGRQDNLKRIYGYDNEPFVRELEKRGFFVARKARANYVQTVLALAAALNMDYLDPLLPRAGQVPLDLTPASRIVDKNAVAAFLKTRGYHYLSIPTGYPLTSTPSADLNLGPRPRPGPQRMTQFEGLILDTTPLIALPRAERSLYDQHREALLSAFDHLSEVPRLPYPKFVFAHILAPHPPFVLGPNGQPITPNRPFGLVDGSGYMWRSTPEEYRRLYIGQLQYTNRRVLSAIDDIFARSRRRPIVIVQGDHGPRMLLDWNDIQKTDLREPFGNLSATALPTGDASRLLYDEISPVNLFRLVLNRYFGTRHERLPDRSYYSTLRRPFQFTDVTDRTEKIKPAR